MRFLLHIIFFFWCSSLLAFDFTDKPWESEELSSILNSNLVLNGERFHKYSDTTVLRDYMLDPCWRHIHSDNSKRIVPIDIQHYEIRAIQYFFQGNEPDYKVVLKGNWESAKFVSLAAQYCESQCEYVEIPLEKIDSSTYEGVMKPGVERSYIQHFLLKTDRSDDKIESLSVSHSSETVDKEFFIERDRISLPQCDNIIAKIEGEISPFGLASIVLLSIITLVLICYLCIRRMYFPMMIMITMFVTNAFGLIFLYFGISTVRLSQSVVSREILSNIALYNMVFVLLAVIGFWLVSAFFSLYINDRVRLARFDTDINQRIAKVILLTSVVFLTYSSYQTLADLFFTYLNGNRGGSVRSSLLRADISSNTFGLKSHHFELIFIHFPIFLSLYFVSKALLERKYFNVLIFVSLAIPMLIYNGEKAPLIWYCFSVAYLLLVTNRLSNKWFMSLFLLGLLSVTIIFLLPWQNSLSLLLDRTFFGASTVNYYGLKIFPTQHSFLDGESISMLGFRFAENYFNLELYLWRNIFSSSYFSSLTGTATGIVWMQGYANFGLPGMLLFSILFGSVVSFYFNAIKLIDSKAVVYPLFAFLIFHYVSFGESNLTRYLLDYYLIGVLALTCVVVVIKTISTKYLRLL